MADRKRKQKGDPPDIKTLHDTGLYVEVKSTQWPIVYRPEYNIGFLGLEKLHPFDAGKWGKVHTFLKDAKMLRDDTTVQPEEATEKDLLVVHDKSYISSLKWSLTVAGITEIPPVALLPNFIVQRKVLRPFRYQTGGTILAAKLAVERGWGINIGGGFHHCSAERGGGFCAYADITLAIKFLFFSQPSVSKVMIIDLDAHQGNGHERDFMGDESVYIMDVYNRGIYPHDGYAKRAIRKRVELAHYTDDQTYLDLVSKKFDEALSEFHPDVIVYNAGTDILDGDPLGCLSVSPQGIIFRDQLVFEKARSRDIPIVMVTSGGYQRSTARIIADSILNLRQRELIFCEEAENCHTPTEEKPAPAIPRTSSEVGLFTRLKNACLSSTRSSTQDFNLDPNHSSGEDKTLSRSTSDIHSNGVEAEEEVCWRENSVSKSCSDLRYSFKDESDVDISSLLDQRFGIVLKENMGSKEVDFEKCDEQKACSLDGNCVPSDCTQNTVES